MLRAIHNGVVKATIWSSIQRFGGLAIGFITNMVLARLLCPEDFGCIGLIMVFVGFADVLVDSGLGRALVFKKNPTSEDYATVFTSNLLISIALFTCIFFAAPAIGRYVGVPQVGLYLRVESVAVLIRAFYVIQSSVLTKDLRFKDLSIVSIVAALCSAIISIIMAAMGCGVWSLVAKNVILQLCTCILCSIIAKRPCKIGFRLESFKELFSYGWFVALTAFMDLLYSNLVSFIIGKRYSVEDLGYYNQAYSLKQIPVYSMSMIISQVLFPFMAKMQDDNERIKYNTQRAMSVTTFIVFPILIYLCVFAKPVIILIYSSKWVPSVIYFQILIIGGLVNSLIHICRNVLSSIGETKTLFWTQFIITVLGITLVIFSMRYDIKILVFCVACCSFINWILVGVATGKKIGYSFLGQIKDVSLSLLLSIMSAAVTYYVFSVSIHMNVVLTIVLSLLLFVVIYATLHFLFKSKAMSYTLNILFPDKFLLR